jgi:hypothetical protein
VSQPKAGSVASAARSLPIKDIKALSEQEIEAEAQRIARELVKLYRLGIIAGPDDPEAIFCARLLQDFGATVLPGTTKPSKGNPDGKPPPGVSVPGQPYTPTREQLVRISYGLSKKEISPFLQADLDSLND